MTQINPYVDTGDPFQDAFSSGLLNPPEQNMFSPYLGAGMMGAGLGGILGGQKYAVPGMLGGAALGMLANHFLGK